MALRLFRLCSNGPATNVEVLDMLPSGVQFNSQQATHGGYNSTTGIWNLAAPLFLAGESATLELTVTVDGGTGGQAISNTAAIESVDQTDPAPGNDSDDAVITVQ
jgi:hypothetical protein